MKQNIVYLRVSKERKDEQDPKQQLSAILTKYNLKEEDCQVYTERISGYKIENIRRRDQFKEVLRNCFNADNITIMDCFEQKFEAKEINLYVWDYARIIRNIHFNLFFTILTEFFSIDIHSYKDKSLLQKTPLETPIAKLIRVIMNLFFAFSAEEYSYVISQNTLKSIVKQDNDLTHSSYNIAFGTFKAADNWKDYWSESILKKGNIKTHRLTKGGNISMTYKEKGELVKYIKHLLRTTYKHRPRTQLIELIKKEKGVVLSTATLSRLSKDI